MTTQQTDLAQQVAAVIIGLPVRLRTVFVMAHVQRRPREEIAAALGISKQSLERRMTKALIVCRERLEARGVDIPPTD